MTSKANTQGPPPGPVSGIQQQHKALAPSLVDMPKDAPNPVKEAADRQRAAIEKLTGKSDRDVVEKAGEDAAPPPKAAPKASGASATSPAKTPPAESSESKAVPSKTDAPKDAASTSPGSEAPAAAEAPKGPRYELKSFRKWAEEHPEDAAEIGKAVYKLGEEPATEWIRLQNKRRKMVGEMTKEREKTLAEARAEREQAAALHEQVTKAAGALTPIADLWEAVRERPDNPDFDAADAAFQENTGLSIDDYMRARARRGIVSPDVAKLKAENARLKREAAAGKPEPAKAKEEPAVAPPEKKAEPVTELDWSAEIPKGHKLRNLAGWEGKLAAEMKKYHDADLDEYSADPEDIADKVLKRELSALTGDDDESGDDEIGKKIKQTVKIAAKPKPKLTPAVTAKKKPVAELPDDPHADAPKNFEERQRWAIDRAQRRARGEVFE